MRCSILVAVAVQLFLVTATYAGPLYPLSDEQFANATRMFIEKKYPEAWESAKKSTDSPLRDFFLGITAARLENWQEAAEYLGKAADKFPLLSDYALHNQARALYQLGRYGEALLPAQKLSKEFPDSPLLKNTLLLAADSYLGLKEYRNAQQGYQKFIEKYPSGADSLEATYNAATCQEQMGDVAGAATSLRSIWLKYPGSGFAGKADDALKRLSAMGVKIEPYSTEELLKRATTLYDLKRYDDAARALATIPLESQQVKSVDRYQLKRCLALFKARHYKEAESAFGVLLQQKISAEVSDDANYWLARTLDKNGKEEQAYNTFLRLAEATANRELAGNALFQAALIKKGQKNSEQALTLLKKLLASQPDSSLRQNTTWQIAWESYRSGDMKSAAEFLNPLTDAPETREKALYWYAHALVANGDTPGAQAAIGSLLAEFPYGFYALSYRKKVNLAAEEMAFPAGDFKALLPIPSGNDRVKVLITLGLYDEARKELSASKRKLQAKNGVLTGLARFYLEMDDFNGAYNLLKSERPRKFDKSTIYQWGISYPLGYQEHIARLAAEHSVPEALVYALIRAESSFSPTALSPVGAVGLMQLMPATATALAKNGSKQSVTATLTNPGKNINFGIRHLRDLLSIYRGDQILAIAAYNAGSGNVNRWRNSFGNLPEDQFVENIPFAETREYVKKVLASSEIYRNMYKLDKLNKLDKPATEPTLHNTPLPATQIPAEGATEAPSPTNAASLSLNKI